VCKNVSNKGQEPYFNYKKLINLSLSGQRLGLVIHNHLNSRIHLCWSTKTDKLNYKDCIERVFLQEKEWLCVCKALKTSSTYGLAECVVRSILYKGDHTVECCIFLEKSMWGKRLEWLKYLNVKRVCLCLCPVSSSLVIK